MRPDFTDQAHREPSLRVRPSSAIRDRRALRHGRRRIDQPASTFDRVSIAIFYAVAMIALTYIGAHLLAESICH